MVNTFLPFANFKKCAKVLDNKRLGKQRVEAKQIISILTDATKTKGWRSHPAVLMWKGHAKALMCYYNEMIDEWILRGYQNNMPKYNVKGPIKLPWFIGVRSVHLSHQANLIRKDASYYLPKFPGVPEEYVKHTYIWPSKLTQEQITFLIKNKNKAADIKNFTTLRV